MYFQRFEESLNKPLRTYRVEFNLGGPSGEVPITDEFTTSYSTSQ